MTLVRFSDVGDYTLETGCVIAGHNGQYIPDELARFAEGLGWNPDPDDDPRIIRLFAEAMGRLDGANVLWEWHSETTDDILAWLNDRVEDGFAFDYDDGEIFLYDMAYWVEGR